MNPTYRRVIMVVGGTRGDVQPFVALAHALQHRNVPVVIAAPARWRALLSAQHIAWYEIPDDPTSLLLMPAYYAALSLQHGVWRGVWHTLRFLRDSRMHHRALLAAVRSLHRQDALIVASVATQWAMPPRCGMWGLLQPVIPTDSFASPLWPLQWRWRSALTTHRMMHWLMWQPWRWAGGETHGGLMAVAKQPAVLAVSPALLPRWTDRQPQHVVTGAWTIPDQRPLPADVVEYMQRGRPYVVITMGSPGANDAASWYEQLIDEALACDVAVIVQLPKSVSLKQYVHRDVCLVRGDINHATLFRGAVAVIHHGGAGTFHTVCAAGVPSLIIARGVDQCFWGAQAVAVGVSPVWIARRQAKFGTITRALADIVADPAYRYRARAIAQQMAAEQGADLAAQIIAQYVRA